MMSFRRPGLIPHIAASLASLSFLYLLSSFAGRPSLRSCLRFRSLTALRWALLDGWGMENLPDIDCAHGG